MEQVVSRAINKCKDHPSIRVIRQHVLPNANVFQFSHVNSTVVVVFQLEH